MNSSSSSCIDRSFGLLPKDTQLSNMKVNYISAQNKLVSCQVFSPSPLVIAEANGPQTIPVGLTISNAVAIALNGSSTIQGNIGVSSGVDILESGPYLITWNANCPNGTVNANLRMFVAINGNIDNNNTVYAFDGGALNLSGTENSHIFGKSEIALLKAGDTISVYGFSAGSLANPVTLNYLRLSVSLLT